MGKSDPQEPKRRWYQYSLRTLLLFVAVAGIGLGWLGSKVQRAREAARSGSCEGRVNQLQMAFQNYHEEHGHFPPAYIADDDGKPMHSWRVLLLPYLDGDAVYKAYNFDEPWNGPNNRKLAKTASRWFHCPNASHGEDSPITDYVVVVGSGTVFPGAQTVSLSDIADGPENTILLVEIENSDIHWMEPRDLRFEEMAFTVNGKVKPSISGPHPAGPIVVFADEMTGYRIHDSVRPETLRALLTISGGDDVNRERLERWDDEIGEFLDE